MILRRKSKTELRSTIKFTYTFTNNCYKNLFLICNKTVYVRHLIWPDWKREN